MDLVGSAALLLICAATFAHVTIERPGVDLGRRLLALSRNRVLDRPGATSKSKA